MNMTSQSNDGSNISKEGVFDLLPIMILVVSLTREATEAIKSFVELLLLFASLGQEHLK
ncbi:MAG: hypothetical protein K2W82_06325 [Candidatus Obscuribacterales bacterium]|nr:hypothetical protein [Candidatus Obscuribacterales bacterium]